MNIEETPTLEMYDNDDGIEVTPDELTEDLEPTPDFSTDVYLNSPIVLPREENMDRGEVVSWKQDVYGKPIGRENVNPILDSRWYEVDFDNGDVTEITANIIVERMYAQCGKKGNDMLLLNSFIDYRKSEWAMSLQYQQITVNGRSHRGRDTRNWPGFGLVLPINYWCIAVDGQTRANRHQHGDLDVGFTFGVAEGGTIGSGRPCFLVPSGKAQLGVGDLFDLSVDRPRQL